MRSSNVNSAGSTATWVGLAGTPMADPDPAPAWRRDAATGLDYAMVAPWLAILGAVGFGLRRAGALNTEVPHTWSGRLGAQLLVAVVLTVPVTLWLAWWEAKRHSTPGKRVLCLRVDGDEGSPLSFRPAVLRSAIKVALPWGLAHAAIWQTIGREVIPLTVVLVGLAYVVCGTHLVLVCRGGRPVYDRLAHTIVRATLGQRCQDGY